MGEKFMCCLLIIGIKLWQVKTRLVSFPDAFASSQGSSNWNFPSNFPSDIQTNFQSYSKLFQDYKPPTTKIINSSDLKGLYTANSFRFAKNNGFSSLGDFRDVSGLRGFTNGIGDVFDIKHFDSFPKNNEIKSNDLFNSLTKKTNRMRLSHAKIQMQNGIGGITFVEGPGKILIKKDGIAYECLGTVSSQMPFCHGQIRRFQIQNRQDYCYSELYSQLNNYLCIGHNEQRALNFFDNNGSLKCVGSGQNPTLIIGLHEYQQMCGQLPWERIYRYFPNLGNNIHVNLPDNELGCPRADVCVFKPDHKPLPNLQFDISLFKK